MVNRRDLMASCFLGLAGCASFENEKTQDTAQPSQVNTTQQHPDHPTQTKSEYSLEDIWLRNSSDSSLTFELSYIPEGDSNPALELSIKISRHSEVIWQEVPVLDSAGQFTIELSNGEQESINWPGDTADDSHRLFIDSENNGMEVRVDVA